MSVTTNCEGKTGSGQLVSFSCLAGDEKVCQEALQKFGVIQKVTTNRKTNVQHGGLGLYSRFNITQHKYAGGNSEDGSGGYVEVLEISRPPDGRCGIVVHQYKSWSGHSFSEWQTVFDASCFFDNLMSWEKKQEKIKTFVGFKRQVECRFLTPWFYATGERQLLGDFAFPEEYQNDLVFHFGVRCVAYDQENFPVVKTCLGCHNFEETKPRISGCGVDKNQVKIIFWSDGTCYDSRKNFSNTLLPRPLLSEELWIDEAITQFLELLSGGSTSFSLPLATGESLQVLLKKKGAQDPAGKYHVKVSLDNGQIKEGNLDFVPSKEFPTVESFVRNKIKTKEGEKVSVEVISKTIKKKGKKWSGVFFNRK